MVEFEYRYAGKTVSAKGLIFLMFESLRIWHNGEGGLCQGDVNGSSKRNFRKIGTSAIGPITDLDEAEAIAKAYFASKISDKVVFKVGDKVKVIKAVKGGIPNWVGQMDDRIGETMTVSGMTDKGGATMQECSWCFPIESLALASFTPDPDASYEENQAAKVKFYGWTVGSKVKVVRKFEENEGGFTGYSWDSCTEKVAAQGNVVKVTGIRKDHIVINGSNFYPYFALEPVK